MFIIKDAWRKMNIFGQIISWKRELLSRFGNMQYKMFALKKKPNVHDNRITKINIYHAMYFERQCVESIKLLKVQKYLNSLTQHRRTRNLYVPLPQFNILLPPSCLCHLINRVSYTYINITKYCCTLCL